MNIGIVIPWFPSVALKGSFFGNFHHSQAIKLVEMGHKVVVIAGQQPGMPEFENIDGILVYRFSFLILPKIRYAMPNLRKMIRFISKICMYHELELVEFFNSDFMTSIPAIYLKRQIGTPVAVVVNGLPGISWFTGNRLIDSVGWIHTNLIGKRIIKSADGIRLLNEGLYSDILKFGVDRTKIKTIHFGVNINIFSPRNDNAVRAELGLGEEDFLVLYVGRLVKPLQMKGMGFLIEAVKDLLFQYRNLKLVFVGDGDGRVKSEELARAIKSNVRFAGYRNDVYNYMNAADVLVLPSLSEGCPNVVLEACACGTPVVASRVGAVPELIEDGKTGFIVSPRSISEIKQALVQLMENPSLRQRMGKQARARMAKEFTWDATCKKLEVFYKQVISSHKSHGG